MSKRSIGRSGNWHWKPPYASLVGVSTNFRDGRADRKRKRRLARRAARKAKKLRKQQAAIHGPPPLARQSVPGRAPHPFYDSERWRALRFQILKRDGGRCALCGRFPPHVVLHVDHIKPRSRYPALEWDPNNLQVLCEDCNLGKSNKDDTDFRRR